MKSNQENDQLDNDRRWMARALRLATRGLGRSSPNPSVAACLVKDNHCIGSGVHLLCGAAHAEVLAIQNAIDAGHDPRGACIYVTLAPCTSHGKTPPCSDAIGEAGIIRVVAAMADPVQDDAADLFKRLQIDYVCGCLEEIAAYIHGGFIKRATSGLPRVTGKWAMTLDGYLATASGDSKWISTDSARLLSRRRRQVFDAIIVGVGTQRADNPSLESGAARSPRKIIIAGEQIPSFQETQILGGDARVYCFHQDSDERRLAEARRCGVRLFNWNPEIGVRDVFRQLADDGCNDVLVEGGSQIHHHCLAEGLYDRLEIYIGASTLGGGLNVAGDRGSERIELGTSWQLERQPLLLNDSICLRYRRFI